MLNKNRKYIKLSQYSLNREEKNLYDDEYGQIPRFDSDIYKEINNLKNQNSKNGYKLGRNLIELVNGIMSTNNFNNIIKNQSVQLGKTQAIKYIESYIYVNKKFQKNQSTENVLKLGIEKLYIITKLEDTKKQEKLEQFILDKNISVKKLSRLVEILNGKSEVLKMAQEFNNNYMA